MLPLRPTGLLPQRLPPISSLCYHLLDPHPTTTLPQTSVVDNLDPMPPQRDARLLLLQSLDLSVMPIATIVAWALESSSSQSLDPHGLVRGHHRVHPTSHRQRYQQQQRHTQRQQQPIRCSTSNKPISPWLKRQGCHSNGRQHSHLQV